MGDNMASSYNVPSIPVLSYEYNPYFANVYKT